MNKTGDQLDRPTKLEAIQRFMEKVEVNGRVGVGHSGEETPCWNWLGSKQSNGYGRVSCEGKTRFAHRVSYAIFNGSCPVGYHIHHLCLNTGCVNPDHLQAVTPSDNSSESALRNAGGFPEFDPTKKEQEVPF